MVDLVELSEAKAYIRVTHNSEDSMIGGLITAASDAVAELADTWDGEGDAPERLKLAALMLVADWYDNREASRDNVPPSVSWLAHPYRTLEA